MVKKANTKPKATAPKKVTRATVAVKKPTRQRDPLDYTPGDRDKRFGKKLRVRTAELGLGSYTVVERANVSLLSLFDYERGVLPPKEILQRLAAVLDIEPEKLLSGSLRIRYS